MAVVAGAAAAFWAVRRPSPTWHITAIPLLSLAMYMIVNAAVRPALGCTATRAIAWRLETMGPISRPVLAVGLPEKYASQIRVLTDDSIPIRTYPPGTPVVRSPDADVLIFPDDVRRTLDLQGYSIHTTGYEYAVLEAREIRRLLKSADWPGAVVGLRIPFYVAVRRPEAEHQ
mgnify:CR=1 FL=1